MPWGSVLKPSLAIATLKRCVQAAGFSADLHFLNIRFAQQLGLGVYERFSSEAIHPEWFFSQALFGPAGTGELANSWQQIKLNPAAAPFVSRLIRTSGDSEDFCARLAEQYVPKFIDDCVAAIDWRKYTVVGFTTTFAQSLASLLLAKRIKEQFPAVQIVFGGANVDSEMGVEFIKGFPWVDFVVHGEAENSFPDLLRRIAVHNLGEKIPGVSFRCDKGLVPGDTDAMPIINMDEIPVPDYSDYVAALREFGFTDKMNLRLYFESSRGCWWGAKHHCTFCGLNGTTMAYRKKTTDRVYSEIIELSRDYRCVVLSATDNILALEYFSQLLPRLASLDNDVELYYEVKANLSREQIRSLRSAGIKAVQPGIESLSTRILKLMNKGITAIQNIQLLKWCFEYEVDTDWNMLYGFPGETPDDYAHVPETIRMISHLRPANDIGPITFDRFSPYFYDREKYRLTLSPADSYPMLFPPSRVNLHKIAYSFTGDWKEKPTDMLSYIQPVRDALRDWTRQWNEQTVFCYYFKGPEHLTIFDNRPLQQTQPPQLRRIHLNAQLRALYLLCDENHSFQVIFEKLRLQLGSNLTERHVRKWLDDLVVQKLMYSEGDRYLSLAVRRKPGRMTLKNNKNEN